MTANLTASLHLSVMVKKALHADSYPLHEKGSLPTMR